MSGVCLMRRCAPMTVAPPATRSSSSKLSDIARHLVLPDGIVTTAWPSVAAQLERMNMPLDRWQQGFVSAALGKRADGMYAAGVGGVVASIPRQVGKTYTVGALAFSLALLSPDTLIMWTAHRSRTHAETFTSMAGMADRPGIKHSVDAVRKANGERS